MLPFQACPAPAVPGEAEGAGAAGSGGRAAHDAQPPHQGQAPHPGEPGNRISAESSIPVQGMCWERDVLGWDNWGSTGILLG